jgi:hypothetical protein
MFFLANSIAVSMYLIGFCESLLDCMKQYGGIQGITTLRLNDIRIIGISGLVAILVLALVGMDWITRVQIGLLALLVFNFSLKLLFIEFKSYFGVSFLTSSIHSCRSIISTSSI